MNRFLQSHDFGSVFSFHFLELGHFVCELSSQSLNFLGSCGQLFLKRCDDGLKFFALIVAPLLTGGEGVLESGELV